MLLAIATSSCVRGRVFEILATTSVDPSVVVAFMSPGGGTVVNAAGMSAVALTGSCSEEGRDVTLQSSPVGALGVATCLNQTWSTTLDLSSLSDGAVTISADLSSERGGAAETALLSLTLHATPPTITLSSPANGSYANSANESSFSVGGACSAEGQTVTLGGDASGTALCSGGAWSVALDLSALAEGPVSIAADLTDADGNPATQATGSYTKDTVPPGAFSISGATGGGDVTLDAFLMDGQAVSANWGASATATSYDVAIYQNDGTTVECALQSAALSPSGFPACSLAYEETYKIHVVAKDVAGNTTSATNDLLAFYVDRSPVGVNDTSMVAKDAGATTVSVLANDTDADGDSLSVASVDLTGTTGSVTNNGTDVSYTPAAGFTGTDSFSYTVSDGHNGSSVATVTIKVMSPFTWIGAVDSTWATSGNWCGSVVAGACAGGPAPNNTQVAIFDGTCSGANCSATIAAAANVAGIRLNSGYSGTVTQAAGQALTIGSSGYTQSAGTFAGGNSAIAVSGSLTVSGGTFTATSGTLSLTGSLALTGGTFNHNSGLVFMTPSTTCGGGNFSINAPGATFWNLKYGGSNNCTSNWVFTIGAGQTLSVLNTFTLTTNGGSTGYAGANGGTLLIYGNLVSETGAGGGSTVLEVVGSGNAHTYTVTGGTLPALKMNDAGGSLSPAAGTTSLGVSGLTVQNGTLNAPSGTLTVASGNFVFTGGAFNHNNGLVYMNPYSTCGTFTYTFNVPGGVDLWNLRLGGSNNCSAVWSFTVGSGQTVTVLNDFSMYMNGGSSGALVSNGGTYLVYGNVTSGSGARGGTTRLELVGSGGAHTYTSTAGILPSLVLNDAGGSLSPAVGTTALAAQGLSVSNGTFDAPTGTLTVWNGDFAVTGGTFNHSSGLLFMDSATTCGPPNYNVNVPSGVSLWNLTYGGYNNCGSYWSITIGSGQTVTVLNDFSMLRDAGSTSGVVANGGAIQVEGHLSSNTGATGGSTQLKLAGSNAQTVTLTAGSLPTSSAINVNKPAGTVTLASAWSPAAGMTLVQGDIDMAGFNLTLGGALTLTTGTITLNGGTLKHNTSTVIPAGGYQGGTIAP